MFSRPRLRPIVDFESYWASLHRTLSEDYTLPSELIESDVSPQAAPESRVPADCSEIAIEIAKDLAQKGLKPSALFIANRAVVDATRREAIADNTPFPSLRPKVFNGEVAWTNHIVCEAEGLIYDPVFPEPLPRDEYLNRMFDEEVMVNPIVS